MGRPRGLGRAGGTGLARVIAVLLAAIPLWIARAPAPAAQQAGGVSRLVWFDRAGTRVGEVGSFGDIGNIELSPDDRQVAVALLDPALGTRDLWMYDVKTGDRTSVASGPADENWLIWSPDGQRVAFNSFGATLDLYQADAGSGTPELLLRTGDALWPVSWSPDGQRLLVVTNSVGTGNDIWVLPLTGDREPTPLFRTLAAENWATFSPDGRWIAYSSSDTGVSEVYVTRFPATGQRWQVSSGGAPPPGGATTAASCTSSRPIAGWWPCRSTVRASSSRPVQRSDCSRRATRTRRFTPSTCRPTASGFS